MKTAMGTPSKTRADAQETSPSDAPVSLDQAFFETDDPELRAFADKQTGRKLVLLVGTLAVILASGTGLGWAIYHAVR